MIDNTKPRTRKTWIGTLVAAALLLAVFGEALSTEHLAVAMVMWFIFLAIGAKR